jgi:hypothetical protein
MTGFNLNTTTAPPGETPRGTAAGFATYLKPDATSGSYQRRTAFG